MSTKHEYQVPKPDIDPVEVFRQHRRNPSEETRNLLALYYFQCVKYAASRISQRLPDNAPGLGELISAGLDGLFDTIDKFDLDRGIKFETYCAPRIRGSILDELRRQDWKPRLARSRQRRVREVRQSAYFGSGITLSDAEVRNQLIKGGASSSSANAVLRESVERGNVYSLEAVRFKSDSSKVTNIHLIKDESTAQPDANLERRDAVEALLKCLPLLMRNIVRLYYFHEIGMDKIGKLYGVSESRISQLFSLAFDILRAKHGERLGFEPLPTVDLRSTTVACKESNHETDCQTTRGRKNGRHVAPFQLF